MSKISESSKTISSPLPIKSEDHRRLWRAKGIIGKDAPTPLLSTEFGMLFEKDCLNLLPLIQDESIDTVFADPPFNLGKKYGARVDDSKLDSEYLEWSKKWIDECVRVLKPGGTFFIYNLPKWNILLGAYLSDLGLTLRHWIAVNMKYRLPIAKRLYPAHYSLLYFTKGKPAIFRNIRIPIQTCRHCGLEIKDYGGHRKAMNPKGVNLSDVWDDIPPVRHWKFKNKKRKENQLSTKLLYRAIQMTTVENSVVIDPFGGSGTTYIVCEKSKRHWIGCEIENCDVIVERLTTSCISDHKTTDYVED